MEPSEPVLSSPENIPWVEKYRPATLDEIQGQRDILNTLQRFHDKKRWPHLLFYGPAGVGKTTTIKACARMLYGSQLPAMVLELNASDDRGIDVIRNRIKTFAQTRGLFSSKEKLVILDEADSCTSAAQFALRRVIEEYTRTTRFCLICNHAGKIIPALQSRCTRFRFSPLPPDAIREQILAVSSVEGMETTEDGIQALTAVAEGDMRRILNVMQACFMAGLPLTANAVYGTVGQPSPDLLDQIYIVLASETAHYCFQFMREHVLDAGFALADILKPLTARILRTDYPEPVLATLLSNLGKIEFYLAEGASSQLQLGGVIAALHKARDDVENLAQSMEPA